MLIIMRIMYQIKLKKFITYNWELITLIMCSLISHDSLRNIDRSSLSLINPTSEKVYLHELIYLRLELLPLIKILIVLFVLIFAILFTGKIKGKIKRKILDLIGSILILKFSYQIVCSNLLLFNKLKSNDELLLEVLLLFFSSIIIFGWIYWRIDYYHEEGPNKHISFNRESSPFEYFYLASLGLHSRVALTSSALTLKTRIITYIHALCMFDLFGLSFSHSVALAMR